MKNTKTTIYIYTYTYIYTHIHKYIYTQTYKQACKYIPNLTHAYTLSQTNTYKSIHTQTNTYIFIHTYTFKPGHTYIYINTHIPTKDTHTIYIGKLTSSGTNEKKSVPVFPQLG